MFLKKDVRMWLDCFEVFVNMEKVDYISFDLENNIPTAYLYFTGRTQPLKLQNDSLEDMVSYFSKWTVGEKK